MWRVCRYRVEFSDLFNEVTTRERERVRGNRVIWAPPSGCEALALVWRYQPASEKFAADEALACHCRTVTSWNSLTDNGEFLLTVFDNVIVRGVTVKRERCYEIPNYWPERRAICSSFWTERWISEKTPCSTTNGRMLSGLSRQNLIVRYPRWRKRPPD